jgi:hydroxycarboxylate dehydrogenase B
MPNIQSVEMRQLAAAIFTAAGATAEESRIVGDALVEANLDGHDSHGVVRISEYVGWMEKGLINVGAHISIDHESDAFAVIDGNWGWGQVVAKEAMEVGIKKASSAGVGTISVRQCCHIGRAGDFVLQAAQSGMAAVMFVNTHGAGKLVAPWGGRERRLSANPIAMAVPRPSGEPILVDISTCAIAGGKIQVALNSKKSIPANCVLDAQGQPTTNPADFFGPPEGALLPMAGHKGFALALVGDILAGGLSGAGLSRPDANRVGNSFLAVVMDVDRFRDRGQFNSEVDALEAYVKSSKLAPGFGEIMIPGEPERRERAKREKTGLPLDDQTWREICETAARYKVATDNII